VYWYNARSVSHSDDTAAAIKHASRDPDPTHNYVNEIARHITSQ